MLLVLCCYHVSGLSARRLSPCFRREPPPKSVTGDDGSLQASLSRICFCPPEERVCRDVYLFRERRRRDLLRDGSQLRNCWSALTKLFPASAAAFAGPRRPQFENCVTPSRRQVSSSPPSPFRRELATGHDRPRLSLLHQKRTCATSPPRCPRSCRCTLRVALVEAGSRLAPVAERVDMNSSRCARWRRRTRCLKIRQQVSHFGSPPRPSGPIVRLKCTFSMRPMVGAVVYVNRRFSGQSEHVRIVCIVRLSPIQLPLKTFTASRPSTLQCMHPLRPRIRKTAGSFCSG